MPRADRRRSLLVAGMIGVPVMAALDTIVFHQLLRWHHFYDSSTQDVGLLSDGLLQATYLGLLVAGFLYLAALQRRHVVAHGPAWAGFVLGLGAFQLFDGLVNHKVLRVHQIRYGVDDLLPYDLTWNLFGVFLLVLGALLARRARGGG
ncbi:MAG: DUF2243 domain-containing protein [Actinomycetota bacterium]|nr:DUF2243 domain-containing protein [Actinomycetota bacterium]